MVRIRALRYVTAAWLAAAGVGRGAETVTGTVFRDANDNGRRERGEAGIPGVAVSNGRDVVLTGADGRYRLTVAGDAVLFVSPPSGYRLPVSSLNLPQGYRIHRPAGDPPLYYEGMAPTGPLGESLNFGLVPTAPVRRFSIAVLADTQPQTSQELSYVVRDVLSELVGGDYLFGLSLGDIMFDDLSLFVPYNKAVARLGFPFYNVVGNHDLNFDAADDVRGMATFTRLYGPPNRSWTVGDVHFVAMDSILFRGADTDGRIYTEGFDETALAWLANDLRHVATNRLVVLCTHSPIRYPHGDALKSCVNAQALLDILAGRNVLALNGHTHYTFQRWFGEEDGWRGPGTFHQVNGVTVSGAWWSGPQDERGIPVADQYDGTPNGYTVVRFDGTDYTVHYRAARFGADHQMRVYAPGAHRRGDDPSRTVLANVFYGTPRSRVAYRLDGGPWQAMTHAPQLDPLAVRYYGDEGVTGKPWVRPVRSLHMWEAVLPDGPARGAHALTVRAEVGEAVFRESVIFRVR